MTRIFAKAVIGVAFIGAVACSPSAPSEQNPSESATAPAAVEPAEPTAAKASSERTSSASAPKVTPGGCREEPAGDRGTEKMIAMGNFGGVTLYGSKGQLACSEPGPGGFGECELAANAVAIAKGKTGNRALIGSSQGTVIWYGGKGVSCVKRLVE